jgi:hypothetical protein
MVMPSGNWTVGRVLQILRQEYIPVSDMIRRSSAAAFIIEPCTIEGRYGYMDIPCMIFKYTVSDGAFQSDSDLLTTIEENAMKAGWKPIERHGRFSRFGKVKHAARNWDAFEVRIVADAVNGVVYVGWISGDSSTRVDSFEDLRESKWANKKFWPRFDRLTTNDIR